MTNEELWHRNLKLEIRHVEMKDELDAAKAEIERLKNELGDPRGEIDHAKSITSALDAEISTLKAENERLRNAVWTVSDTETAAEILSLLGIGSDPSREPGADRRRDKVALIIGACREKARNKALDEASEVAARYGDFVVAAEIKALKEQA